jgi:hypothetical protein
MSNKVFRIYKDSRLNNFFIAPNKVILPIIMYYFYNKSISPKYIESFVSEIGYFNKNLIPVYYDIGKKRTLLNDFISEFRLSAKDLKYDFLESKKEIFG